MFTGSVAEKTIDNTSLLEACIAPSSTRRSNHLPAQFQLVVYIWLVYVGSGDGTQVFMLEQ